MASPSRFTSGVWAGNKGSAVKTEAPIKQVSIPIRFSDGTSLNNTTFTFPANAIVWPQVVLFVRSAEVTGTTKTINIGIGGGNGDDIAKGISVAAAGLVKATVLKGAATLGQGLSVDGGVGADVANVPETNVVWGGLAVTWTPGSANYAELEADIHLFYQEARAQPEG